MKKILLASSALMLTAGVASAAEISFSGNARFGLAYSEDNTVTNANGDTAATQSDTRIEQRVRFQVRGTAETDAGVEFSARIRAEAGESADNSISGAGFGAAEFSVSTGGFNLYIGNTSNVIDAGDVVDLYGSGVGLTYILESNATLGAPADGFSSGSDDETTIKVDYSVGDFTVAASYKNDESIDAAAPTFADSEEFQIGLGYDFGNFSAGIAYSSTDTAGATTDYTLVGVNGSFGDFTYNLNIADGDNLDDVAYGASIAYALSSATSIQAVIGGGGDDANETAYGLGFQHGLGDGVALRGGIASLADDSTAADLGVTFSF